MKPRRPFHWRYAEANRSLSILATLFTLITVAPAIHATDAATEPAVIARDFIPDRRKDQFQTSFGYALFPYPYSLPGIGQGLSLVGGAMNIANTYTDAYALIWGGDVEGLAAGIGDIHLIPQRLIFDGGYSAVSSGSFRSYSERGMNTAKDDYRLIATKDMQYYGGRLTATFFDRRFEVFGNWYQGAVRLDSIRDKDGNLIVEAKDASREWGSNTMAGTRIDLTDDYADPRRGVRININGNWSPPHNSAANSYVVNYDVTAFAPIGKRSTWAFNFLRSDAVVTRKGETDPAKLQEQQGVNCSGGSLSAQEQEYCAEVFKAAATANTYGTATSLGGFGRLRSYSQGRYSGAHTLFFGTEIRWNLTDESTPFNIFVMKDIRTAFQLAAFLETGSTADLRRDLGNTWRNTYGIGARMITASGVVFRADLATGHEGFEPNIWIAYPWEI